MAVPVIKRNPNYCCDSKVFFMEIEPFLQYKNIQS
jgi:hypothetical protein